MIDLERVRADTHGVEEIVHLNSCGSSLPTSVVVDAQIEYLRMEQRMGGYEAAAACAETLDDFYVATATMLGCDVDEVAFQPSASEAWWRAFTSFELGPGDRVLVGSSEFQANAFGLLQARERGVIVEMIPNDDSGTIDLDALAAAIDERIALVCLTQISMSNGGVQPAAAVGRLCQAAGVPFLLDACQAAGQRPLDVDELGCDFLVYTGRKFMRGPRGTGVLYARRARVGRLRSTPFVDGRSATWASADSWYHNDGATRFEFGERSMAGQLGLAVATRYALDIGLSAIESRITDLAERLRVDLARLERVAVRDEGVDRSGIVTFTVAGIDAGDIRSALAIRGVYVGAPGRASAQWDIGRRGIDAVVRVGVHYFNRPSEIDRLLDELSNVVMLDAR